MKFLILLLISMLVQACMPTHQREEPCGYRQNVYGERISWKGNSPVKIFLHSSVPEEMIPAIKAAAESWNVAAGRQVIQIVESPRYGGVNNYNRDMVNVIYYKTDWPESKMIIQGETRLSWVGDAMNETDIAINGSHYGFYWKFNEITRPATPGIWSMVNIEALMLHELGHVLGLDHSAASTSVMNSRLSSGSNRVVLDSISTQSLKCEY
ncbi:matrixin family metalloprotease [Bdellovibrio sp. BCCA]|uniref:matrixin family metalloprotease n=1 Tax=Bdellovibrio sp. BCCA TaxID=3136281 RepID=UPI0030F33A65